MLTLDEWKIVHQKLFDWVASDTHYPIFLCLETSKVLSKREEYKELMSTYELCPAYILGKTQKYIDWS